MWNIAFESIFLLLPFICVLLAIAFYTLLERKVLGYIMIRKGPNKVGYMGVLQPFSDALKLFSKEFVVPAHSNHVLFFTCPGLILFNSMVLWCLYPYNYINISFITGILQFMVVSSLMVYGVMLAGWTSNSKYAMLGAVRAIAQSVSYEVPLMLVLVVSIYCFSSLWCQEVKEVQKGVMAMVLFNGLECIIWMICMLAESNRAPFDFVEGESELVSGFNVEYSSGGFAMIFMAEYGAMLFNSVFCSVLFIGGSELIMSIFMLFLAVFFLWLRGSFPRMRYDKLMKLCWASLTVLMLVSSAACICFLFSF